jgi:hypothetical protein
MCEEYSLMIPSATIVFISQIYPILMMVSLMKKDPNHLLPGMERNCQLGYCAEY